MTTVPTGSNDDRITGRKCGRVDQWWVEKGWWKTGKERTNECVSLLQWKWWAHVVEWVHQWIVVT